MTLYLNTAVIISAFTNEVDTKRARSFLHAPEQDAKLISWWVETEIAAAIHAKASRSMISTAQAVDLLEEITRFTQRSLSLLAVEQSHFVAARRFARLSPGLRAGDALHLAIASDNNALVCTLDKGMASSRRTCDCRGTDLSIHVPNDAAVMSGQTFGRPATGAEYDSK